MNPTGEHTATDSAALHPTPQLTRPDWLELGGSWGFEYDDTDAGLGAGWADRDHRLVGTIQVPYPPESKLSGIGDTGFHPVLWYQRVLTRDDLERIGGHGGPDARTIAHFGAVDHDCRVYLNGSLLAEHSGGMTPFRVDLTDGLDDAEEQVLTLRVVDDPHDRAQPRGKQDWRTETAGIFYERTSGIWQPVWLERVAPVHVTDIGWSSDLIAGRVDAEIELSRPTEQSWLRVALSVTRSDGAVDQLAETSVRVDGSLVRCTLPLPDVGRPLWTPENPQLVDATVELITTSETPGTGSDQPVDRVQSYLGLRSVGFRDGRFLLNGVPYYLRSVLEQGYWPESHLAAPSPAALRREVELIKELGFNTARIHQKVEDPRFLYWCDRLGLAVWGEAANAFVFNRRSMTLLTTEWLDVIKRDRSHPSILAWVPINESWGVPQIAQDEAQQHYASSMYHLTKALDPTRPTMSNEGWEHTESDIWGVHDYSPSADGIRHRYSDAELERTLSTRGPGRRKLLLNTPDHRGQPVMITEFGGISFTPRSGERWFGYATYATEQEFLDQLDALVTAIAETPAIAGFCYTQLTDTGQETNGLLREDRTAKLPIDQIRTIITTPSRAIGSEEVDAHRRAARAATRGEGEHGQRSTTTSTQGE